LVCDLPNNVPSQ
jgi:hypothetical protein